MGSAHTARSTIPPVDIRLDDPPSVVVTSPRHAISRGDEALVVPGLSVLEREGIEEALQTESNLSALVSDIGGVATYPAIVRSGFPLRHILQTGAHEWLHHYLVAHLTPLGLRTYQSNEMLTINETLADLVGREIGDMAYVGLGGTIDPPPNPAQAGAGPEVGKFDFSREMRATRLRVDSLLAEGKVGRGGDVHGGAAASLRRKRLPPAKDQPGVLRIRRHVRGAAGVVGPGRRGDAAGSGPLHPISGPSYRRSPPLARRRTLRPWSRGQAPARVGARPFSKPPPTFRGWVVS